MARHNLIILLLFDSWDQHEFILVCICIHDLIRLTFWIERIHGYGAYEPAYLAIWRNALRRCQSTWRFNDWNPPIIRCRFTSLHSLTRRLFMDTESFLSGWALCLMRIVPTVLLKTATCDLQRRDGIGGWWAHEIRGRSPVVRDILMLILLIGHIHGVTLVWVIDELLLFLGGEVDDTPRARLLVWFRTQLHLKHRNALFVAVASARRAEHFSDLFSEWAALAPAFIISGGLCSALVVPSISNSVGRQIIVLSIPGNFLQRFPIFGRACCLWAHLGDHPRGLGTSTRLLSPIVVNCCIHCWRYRRRCGLLGHSLGQLLELNLDPLVFLGHRLWALFEVVWLFVKDLESAPLSVDEFCELEDQRV